ncbi:MAG: zinc ribbon domain-containing protein [Myxococcota bacterium]
MSETLQTLRALQAADNQIAALKVEIAAVPEKLAGVESRREAARGQVKAVEDNLAEVEHQRREKEGEVQTENERLLKYKTQLNQIKTNKEYTAMLHEIETTEKRIGDHEEQILLAMEAADAAKTKLSEVKDLAAKEESACNAEDGALRARAAEAERALAEAEAARKAAAAATDAAILKRYEQIRSAMRGIAVVEARKAICQGCQVGLPPQLYNELFKGDALHVCPSCQRILYFDPEAAEGGS